MSQQMQNPNVSELNARHEHQIITLQNFFKLNKPLISIVNRLIVLKGRSTKKTSSPNALQERTMQMKGSNDDQLLSKPRIDIVSKHVTVPLQYQL